MGLYARIFTVAVYIWDKNKTINLLKRIKHLEVRLLKSFEKKQTTAFQLRISCCWSYRKNLSYHLSKVGDFLVEVLIITNPG